MIVRVNREELELAEGATLLDLLASKNYSPERVLASVNGQVCPANDYGAVRLRAGDEIELFRFVCGG